MDKYLLEILKSVNTIIIPGLGALTITDHDSGEIMFMSYLKHDDGKLTQYIVENEGLEELDAKNLIAKYVREIQLTIDKGESYDMFQFGSFYKNGDEIDFRNWEGSTSSEPEKNEEPTSSAEEKVIETISEEKVDEITPPITEKKTEIVKDEIIPTPEEKIIDAPAKKTEPVVVHLKEEAETPKKELNLLEKKERAKAAAKLDKLKSEKEKSEGKKKKGVAFWILISLLVLIAAGGTYFGMNYDRLKQHVPFLADTSKDSKTTVEPTKETPASDENTMLDEEETQAEETIDQEIEPTVEDEEIIETPPVTSGRDLPFHIIAGAFSSEANANRLGEKLRAEGYTVKVGPGRGMNLVSIKSFATRNEAQNGINELRSVAPSGWIYEWR